MIEQQAAAALVVVAVLKFPDYSDQTREADEWVWRFYVRFC